jgi:catechol 2,3-dioxygenase
LRALAHSFAKLAGGCHGAAKTVFEWLHFSEEALVIKLKGIGHVLLRVGDEAASKRFYRDVLGFAVAEEDPEHGGVFMTLGENFHTLDIAQHPAPESAPRPTRGQIGLAHIAFEVASYAALREAYAHLVANGVEILRATNHVNQRSFYFADPDGNTVEIYYEVPHALELFAGGRADRDEALVVSGPGEPLPAWLLEDWPGPEMAARIDALRQRQGA